MESRQVEPYEDLANCSEGVLLGIYGMERGQPVNIRLSQRTRELAQEATPEQCANCIGVDACTLVNQKESRLEPITEIYNTSVTEGRLPATKSNLAKNLPVEKVIDDARFPLAS